MIAELSRFFHAIQELVRNASRRNTFKRDCALTAGSSNSPGAESLTNLFHKTADASLTTEKSPTLV